VPETARMSEFISGAKVPFELGQNVIQGTNNNIQQFFYKHVGGLHQRTNSDHLQRTADPPGVQGRTTARST